MFPPLQLPSLTLLAITLVVIFAILKQFNRSNSRVTTPKLPPAPWKLPIIGHLHHLIGRSNLLHMTFTDMASKLGMPIMHLQLGKLSFVVISTPEIAEEVLKTNEVNFAQRFQLIEPESHPYPDCSLIFAPYNDYYKCIRKISVTDLFSVRRVRSLNVVRQEEVRSLVRGIREQGSAISVNLSEAFYLLIYNIVTRSVLGNKSDYLEDFKSCLADVISSTKSFNVDDVFPFLKVFGFHNWKKSGLKRVFKRMDNVLTAIIEEHNEKRTALAATISDDDAVDEDLLDVLLSIQESDQDKLTHDHIKNLILDIFAAGIMVLRSILEWTMAELLRHPRIMEKAQAEVRKVVKLKEEDTKDLLYLKSVVKETIRLHVSTPLLPRETIKTCEINGFLIPEKTKILVNTWAMCRDPKYWSDPNCFKPERFESERSNRFTTHGMEYFPFGAGRRSCPGEYFGVTSIEFALAKLLRHFNWKLPQGLKPEDLDMNEASEITSRRKIDLYAVAVRVL